MRQERFDEQGAPDEKSAVTVETVRRDVRVAKKKQLQKIMSTGSAALKERAEHMGDGYDELQMATPEEIAARTERAQKIEHIYWEKAPEILADMLAEERENEAWKIQTKAGAQKLLEDEMFAGTELRTIDCRETLCRVDLWHKSAAEFETFKNEGTMLEPWVGDQYGTHEKLDNGEIQTTLYFSNNGPLAFDRMRDRMVAIVEGEEN